MEMACAFIVVEVTWVYVFARTTPNCTFQVGIFYVNYSLPIVHLKMSKWLKKCSFLGYTAGLVNHTFGMLGLRNLH